MTRDDARALLNRRRALFRSKMDAWDAITEDPSSSEEGRRQWAAYKHACRLEWAAHLKVERARKRYPHYFAPFTADPPGGLING